jgi:hypothetical protein
MWIGVTQRFNRFHLDVLLTEEQKEDGKTKHYGVRKCLNSHYYGVSSEKDNSFLVGSWGKLTRVRPPGDIDLYFVLPYEVYKRFNAYVGNKQSALLQEVKGILQKSYPATEMRGDGQVIVVKFTSINVEVVPVFKLENGRYWICDTNGGGTYREADPHAEESHVSSIHDAHNNNLRPLVRMLKVWKRNCNVPLKSFHVELLAADFLRQCEWKMNGFFYYDWIMRDFFKYLQSRENGVLFVPGTYETLYLGNAWKSRCESAYSRALKACEYEHADYVNLAGEEWRKIFGDQIPQDPL